MRISDWSSDVCSSDLVDRAALDLGDDLDPVRRIENEGAATKEGFALGLVAAKEGVAGVAVALFVAHRDPGREIVRKGARDDAEHAAAAQLELIAAFEPRLEPLGRPRGDDADRAGAGLLADQRSLRAAQPFDPLAVE